METMNIVIAVSKDYSRYAHILLHSLFESNKNKFHIYCYYNEEIDNQIEYMEKLSKRYGHEFTPMFVTAERIKGTEEHDAWHSSTWYRWLCLDDLKDKCDRILILGVDIIITKDISNFYFQNLGDKCMAAIQDPCNMYEWYIIYDECRDRGKSIEDYVNVDVVLLDVKKAQKIFNLDSMLTIYRDECVYCMDQGILNYYYSKHIKVIKNYDYNFGVNVAYETLDEAEYKRQVDAMSILHFAGRKPWNSFDASYAHSLWLQYAEKSPIYKEILQDISFSLARKMNEKEKYIHKMDVLFDVLDRFVIAKENGILLGNFRRLGLNTIVIYGFGKLGRHLLNYCNKNNIKIQCILDIKEQKGLDELQIYSLENIPEMQEVDAVVVTPVYQYDAIRKNLLEQIDIPIMSLEELLK